jgi:molecular chaperone Hsp33
MTSQSPETKITLTSPVRAPSAVPVDDAVIPFEVDALDLRGRLTRMGPALDEILTKHDYPAPVGKLLGEAIVLTTLLGSSLKFDGRFILQTQTDGPVSFLIVDFQAPDRLRAYARYDRRRLAAAAGSGALLGKGHLAMTIDQGPDMSRSALRADPDPRAHRGRRGMARRRGRQASLARRRRADAVPAEGAGACTPGRPASG